VTLTALTAVRRSGRVVVRWRAAHEARLIGFDVYRDTRAGRVRLNTTLVAAATALAARAYNWVDRRAPRRAAQYWVRTVSVGGSVSWWGPVRAPAA
jgi:hypothetical protein